MKIEPRAKKNRMRASRGDQDQQNGQKVTIRRPGTPQAGRGQEAKSSSHPRRPPRRRVWGARFKEENRRKTEVNRERLEDHVPLLKRDSHLAPVVGIMVII